jgi:hypothetical protein
MRARCSGTIRVAAPIEEAFPLFTAEGERRWAAGWDPRFPESGEDETEPGTVFTTAHGDAVTTWIVVAAEPPVSIVYARCAPGDRAGTVTIVCSDAGLQETDVRVSYDLTALTAAAEPALHRFEEHFPPFLETWRESIESALQRSAG